MNSAINNEGFQLLECIALSENRIHEFKPIAGSYAVIRCGQKYLICFNKWRKQWEVPAGKCEEGETPKECAIRELFEETSQKVHELEFIGLIKVKKPSGEIKFNPIYYTSVDEVTSFKENEETDKILLWDLSDEIGCMDEIDKEVLKWCHSVLS